MTYAKAKERTRVREKHQTPSQRITNAMWLRNQIQQLVKDCDSAIKEDLSRADQTYGDVSQSYRASVSSTRHWKRQLERILHGKTRAEEIAETVGQAGGAS